jgi:hypothetical protein
MATYTYTIEARDAQTWRTVQTGTQAHDGHPRDLAHTLYDTHLDKHRTTGESTGGWRVVIGLDGAPDPVATYGEVEAAVTAAHAARAEMERVTAEARVNRAHAIAHVVDVAGGQSQAARLLGSHQPTVRELWRTSREYTLVLISAQVGDRAPGVDLALLGRPTWAERPEVEAWMHAQGYGPDADDEPVYVTTWDRIDEVPDGFETLLVPVTPTDLAEVRAELDQ